MTGFRRYVAIGDSSTEGLMDLDDAGGYRGWADRLAQHVADSQDEPVEYANLAVRGLHAGEIRETQLPRALELQPDLLTVFAGVNDVISVRCDFAALEAELEALFAGAATSGATLATFTMVDPGAVNPLVRHVRGRVFRLNRLLRSAALRHGAVLVDFEAYPVAVDPRLWCPDRLHNSALGHARIAAALAWGLGLPGSDASWSDPLEEDPPTRSARDTLAGDLDWVVHHFSPWLGKAVRHVPHGLGVTAKRPEPTVVPRSSVRTEGAGTRLAESDR
ncbi:Lysophospholipase L1 [Microlunatus sagamiharensis]|uniref:Lysophospholipase L1 n=1 Tax=Microlunatus sagamiharensis TaxID=546874 RepID=A0A1H2N661_9ACTN|nr:SGNH/GDSL hydrolase family protein [Microlunatus sagamiharensis]SDV00575.1 Lysophospholipase L1 [Microlunatus sagamiharensis]